MKRHLIVSADERSWKFDRPISFLGEWCLLPQRKHVWSGLDYTICAPYGLAIQERVSDYSRTTEIREFLLEKLSLKLNHFHGKSYSQRFWQILIGDWLTRYVDTVFNRVKSLQLCLAEGEFGSVTFIKSDVSLVSRTSLAAVGAANDDSWNQELFRMLWEQLNPAGIVVETRDERRLNMSASSDDKKNGGAPDRRRLGQFADRVSRAIGAIPVRQTEAMVINTYLPPIKEIQLQLGLGQIPRLWGRMRHEDAPIATRPDQALRDKLQIDDASLRDDRVQTCILRNVFRLMPVCYLEGFHELEALVAALPWPKRPKFMFTSSNYDFDEVFKLYAAQQVDERGTPYFIGCHGNGFFEYFENPSNCEVVADKYLTWGWTHNGPNNTPAFLQKTAGMRAQKSDPAGGLLLVEMNLFNRVTTWDVYAEYADYFAEQTRIVSSLDADIRQRLTIKLHGATHSRGWGEYGKWKDMFDDVSVVDGSRRISDLIRSSRLVVYGYDSTGLCESLAMNTPTMAIFQVGYEQTHPDSRDAYDLLIDAGIMHESAESLARNINAVWDDVAAWWCSPKVQHARLAFCEQYARTEKRPIKVLKHLLTPTGAHRSLK